MRHDPYRVVQWSTGQVGIQSLKGIIQHPALELAGLWVHSESKEGRDAGELCGLAPVGVKATRDVDTILALGADCVCYTATHNNRGEVVIDDYCHILSSGANVVSATYTPLVYPPQTPDVTKRLEEACAAGRASLYIGGIQPGFMLDVLPIAISSLTQRIDFIELWEIIDTSTWNDPVGLRGLGFGMNPRDFESQSQDAMAAFEFYWLGNILLLAHALQAELDEIHISSTEVALAKKAFDIPAFRVEEGTIAGLHVAFDGTLRGEARIRHHEYATLASDIAPEWPQPPGTGGYRVSIKGTPSLFVEVGLEGPDPIVDALICTAMRLVNSIPVVCEAEPGVHSFLSLGHVAGILK